VLFSREDVATFVNRSFEASWETVRPVPIVRIDFGDGNVVTRTLHGNIATHVCAADGQIVDILPGIYTPAPYQAALGQLQQLAVSLPAGQERQARLREFHRAKVQELRARPETIAYAPPAAPRDGGKRRIELRTEQIVLLTRANNQTANHGRPARPPAHGNLADWEPLAADTWRNETERRLQIHERLADSEPLRPEQIKRWLYREVLHADLDDRYLGLGDALLGDDVFREQNL
jgi:hypothetical protein